MIHALRLQLNIITHNQANNVRNHEGQFDLCAKSFRETQSSFQLDKTFLHGTLIRFNQKSLSI